MEIKLLLVLSLISLTLAGVNTVNFRIAAPADSCNLCTVSLEMVFTDDTLNPNDYFAFSCWVTNNIGAKIAGELGVIGMGRLSSANDTEIANGGTIYGKEFFFGTFKQMSAGNPLTWSRDFGNTANPLSNMFDLNSNDFGITISNTSIKFEAPSSPGLPDSWWTNQHTDNRLYYECDYIVGQLPYDYTQFFSTKASAGSVPLKKFCNKSVAAENAGSCLFANQATSLLASTPVALCPA